MKKIALLSLLLSLNALATPSIPTGTVIMSYPMTSLGDMVYGGTLGAATRLPGNTAASTKLLCQTGDGVNSAAPSWCTQSGLGFVQKSGDTMTGALSVNSDLTVTPSTTGGGPGLGISVSTNHIIAQIGDFNSSGHGTSIGIDDNAQTIDFHGTARSDGDHTVSGQLSANSSALFKNSGGAPQAYIGDYQSSNNGTEIAIDDIAATIILTASNGFTFNSGSITAPGFIGPLTGNVTGNLTGSVTGNASTATALAANPTDCGANTFATTIDASGNLTCSSVPDAATTATSAATASTIVERDASSDTALAHLKVGAGSVTAAAIQYSGAANTGMDFSAGLGTAEGVGIVSGGQQLAYFDKATGSTSPYVNMVRVLEDDGSASTPSFSFYNKANLGWYRSTTNGMSATSNGTEQLLIDNVKTQFKNGLVYPIRVATATPVTVATTDYFVSTKLSSPAAVTVNLPSSPETGRVYTIKDDTGDAALHPITVNPAAGNIDGASTFVIATNWGSARFVYDGTQWESLDGPQPLSLDLTLTHAQILALNSTPIQIIPTPGSGYAVMVTGIECTATFVTTGYTSTGSLSVVPSGHTSSTLATCGTGIVEAAANTYKVGGPSSNVAIFDNTAVMAFMGTANPTGSSADTVVKIRAFYRIVPVPLP